MLKSLPSFSDTQNHWASPFISGLRERGIVSGFRDGTFQPARRLTRAEFAAILQKAFPLPPRRQYVPFLDVPATFWASAAIQNAFETGFLSGFPNRLFLPQNNITRVQALVSLVAGLRLASLFATDSTTIFLSDFYRDAKQIPSYAIEAIATATFAGIVVCVPDIKLLNPNREITRGEVAALIYQALVSIGQAPAIDSDYIVSLPTPKFIREGTHVAFNGRTKICPWSQWSFATSERTGISDAASASLIGIELLNSDDATRQPAAWFSPANNPLILPVLQVGTCRYLDITALLKSQNWQVRADGKILHIFTSLATIETLTFEEQSSGYRLTINLNQPAPLEIRQQNYTWIVTLEATAAPEIIESLKSLKYSPPNPTHSTSVKTGDRNEGETGGSQEKPVPPTGESSNNQTMIRGNLTEGLELRVYTLTAPYRVIIELRPDALVKRKIIWIRGLIWQQQYLQLGSDRFPVFSLILNPESPQLIWRVIHSDRTQMVGTASLLQMAANWQVIAAINGGFFNRTNLLPLGAIRRDGKWLSGPILNRAAVAWNDTGAVKIGRLTLQETIITEAGEHYAIALLNTGLVQRGIAHYTPEWGENYTPLSDGEIVIFVSNNQVISQMAIASAGKTVCPIPRDGYLLVFRANVASAAAFNPGTQLKIESSTSDPDFNEFPHILGAGPLLIQEKKIVLNPSAEGFSDAFAKQAAIRSCLGITATGAVIFAAIHNRIGGRGPTLVETAQLMQQLEVTDALNLDGGSSTSLYLGGQLLNRAPETAARIHNALGIFRA
ncbi:MAG: phosphodiester glycosidase family protein [Oscillatoriaceae bacterium SKW80]|nr:phosphodiester glycosidase family protein [Oscillatoriaceae bacterium SKW80]HIK27412.1 phosphodiester glycosidase family protein [Oscillatoriaceae cyanobacterium M7585_C2015_266]